MKEESQIKLVEAAVDGHIDSFGELCGRYYASLVAVAYSVLADHQLAEDAAQEAFARALKNLRKLKKAEKFAPWLVQICRNVARDMVDAKARHISTEDVSYLPDNCEEEPSLHAVRQAIEKLPTFEREVLVMRYYNSMSYEKISAVLDISKPTINGRLTRAKRRMAKYLRQQGFLENEL